MQARAQPFCLPLPPPIPPLSALRLQVVRADAKDIMFDNESRRKMFDGINKVTDAVQVTLGPRGACRCRLPLLPPPCLPVASLPLGASRFHERSAGLVCHQAIVGAVLASVSAPN
jgi:hypothetical protein